MELPLEPADLRLARLRRLHAEPARLDRLRPEVHRRDLRRLGRQGLRRHHERRRRTSSRRATSTQTASARPAAPTAATWSTGSSATTTTAALKFKALVSHAGVYNLTSMYGVDRGAVVHRVGVQGHAVGQPGDVRRAGRRTCSSRTSRRRRSSSTASSITASPSSEGLQLFTALQKQDVESKLVVLPGRGPLDSQAAELRALVQHRARLVRQAPEGGHAGGGTGTR